MKTPLELYKLLPRTNCGDCGASTCMAFAAAVLRQEKQLQGCPGLDHDTVERIAGQLEQQVNLESIQQETLGHLRAKITEIDLLSRAGQLGGRISGDGLVISCLGRDFKVDAAGAVRSDCHTHAWFSIPLLDYIAAGADTPILDRWLPFRELPGGQAWSRLFEQRCEKPLKQVADSHPELFEDLIRLFSARTSPHGFTADISVVLYPFPRVPVMVSYWRKEDCMDSKLHLFFDQSAGSRMQIDSLFMLGTGIAMMVEKIMVKHGGEMAAIL